MSYTILARNSRPQKFSEVTDKSTSPAPRTRDRAGRTAHGLHLQRHRGIQVKRPSLAFCHGSQLPLGKIARFR
jgi:hypothetical protein